jgi:hypothetical protein
MKQQTSITTPKFRYDGEFEQVDTKLQTALTK